MYIRSSFFWDVTQRWLVVSYHVSGQPIFPIFFFEFLSFKTGPKGCPEMSETSSQGRRIFKKNDDLRLTPLFSNSLSVHKILKVILKRTLQYLPLSPNKLKIALLVTQWRVCSIQSEDKGFRLRRYYWMVKKHFKASH